MTEPTSRQSYAFAFVMITSLFFMWGFVHNLDPILIPHLRRSFSLSVLQSALVDSAVFIAYFLMALPAGLLIRRAGYKRTMIFGLMLFALGALLFIPAADTQRYSFFLGALFIIACGLTVLETAANPYISMLGRPDRAVQRLNLAQSFNGLAATLAPIVGARLILVEGASDAQLQSMSDSVRQATLAAEAASVKGPYMAIALVIVVIAVIFYFLKLPALGAGGNEKASAVPVGEAIARALRKPGIRRAVIAQFFYVGAQVCVFSFFILYASHAAGLSQIAAADYLGWGCGLAFVTGRFAGTFLMKYIASARLLLIYALICTALSGVAMFVGGTASLAAVIGIAFFMSIMFPTIFALGIRDAGEDTEMGSSLIVMSIVGGAVLPLMFGYISDATHNLQFGYAAPLLCFVVIAWFARAAAQEQGSQAAITSTGALKHV
ncbi:L-fucose:H+ symporter permease [Pseudoduganella namucuonensis]|uniref:MFS transporter, FHS family, L-fucose permease n=1 Tax=Pseudoduganella namucuonensis TaxID=1035707 RepID=A0A1I7JZH9_9BURK|nr:L-fucose:H+ symporter permease [Pseudoduganella namucuonensis]SFU90628.1 MFS transporter, FHS family, L-fucose permease [Pseudoduganella namucuonensis]